MAGLCLCGCSPTVIEVNNKKISSEDYKNRLESFILSPNAIETDGTMTLGEFVIRHIICDEIVTQFAERKDIMPSNQEIIDEVNKIITMSDGKLELLIHQNPQIMESLKIHVTAQLCTYNILTYGVDVSEQEIKERYREEMFFHPEKYLTEEKRFISLIAVTREEDLKKVVDELRNGADFKRIRNKYSTKEFEEARVDFPITRDTEIINEGFINLVFNTREGTYSRPFKVNSFFVIMKVDKVEKTRIISFEEAKNDLRVNIALQKGRTNPILQEEFVDFVKTSKIKVVDKKYKEIMSKFKFSDIYTY